MMFWTDLKSPSLFGLALFMEQLTTLGVEQDSPVRYLASLKSKLADQKAAWKEAKVEVHTLAWAIADLKKMADKFTRPNP
jgi:phage-related tail protein